MEDESIVVLDVLATSFYGLSAQSVCDDDSRHVFLS